MRDCCILHLSAIYSRKKYRRKATSFLFFSPLSFPIDVGYWFPHLVKVIWRVPFLTRKRERREYVTDIDPNEMIRFVSRPHTNHIHTETYLVRSWDLQVTLNMMSFLFCCRVETQCLAFLMQGWPEYYLASLPPFSKRITRFREFQICRPDNRKTQKPVLLLPHDLKK